jgi:hypothetical protein
MQPKRVLLLFEAGRGGGAALEAAREMVETERAALTVVCVAPQAPSGSRCGNSALEYNNAVFDSVAADLDRARARLEELGIDARYQMLIEGHPPLQQFAGDGGFDLVLLPARRRPFRAAGHPAASRLRRLDGVQTRVVDPRTRAGAPAKNASPSPLARGL